MLVSIIYARKKDLIATLNFFHSIDSILRNSCDVVLYNEVLENMLEWLSSKNLDTSQIKSILRPLQQRYILGLTTNQDIDKALKYVEDNKLEQFSADSSIKAGLSTLEIGQAIASRDINTLENVVDKYKKSKTVNTDVAYAHLLILKGNNQEANVFLLETKTTCMLQNVNKAYLLALTYINLDEIEKAKEELEYVSVNACTLPIKYKADAPLDNLK